MPHKTYWEEKGMLIEWSGTVDTAEILKSNGAVYGDKRFDEIKYQINNFLDAEFSDFTDKEVQIISTLELQSSKWNKNLKMVHITKDPDLIANIKLYEKRMENSGWEFLICDTLEEARKWVES